MIHFPVLRNINIKDYQLYMNDKNNGISHNFDGGVHLIVGINGLGKTTLLNSIFRLLVGPKDPPKDGDKNLGSSKHELTSWRSKRYFSSRVPDRAVDAMIDGTVDFGKHSVYIKRKLSNLEVISLKLDGKPLDDISQDSYESLIETVTGLSSYSDFYSVVKFLIFFLEDRSDLIWDATSQFEMFRILFFDKEQAIAATKSRELARSEDSKYRNLRSSLTNLELELNSLNTGEDDLTKKEYTAAKARYLGLQENIDMLLDSISDLEVDAARLKLDIAKSKRQFDEYKFGIEELQHSLASCYFPNLNETVHILLSNLSAGGGCFVCGSKHPELADKIKFALERKKCPICESEAQHQENLSNLVDNVEFSEKRLSKMRIDSSTVLHNIESLHEELNHILSEIENYQEELVKGTEEKLKLHEAIKALEKQLPEGLRNAEELADQIQSIQGILAKHDENRRKATEDFNNILLSQENNLKTNLEKVKRRFEFYSERLLVEKVMLAKEYEEKPLGEGGEKVRLPFFRVKMTSGVHTQSPHSRESNEEVSESQREFIDLAFRLAIFDVISDGNESPAMIVMETPEASLDSLFMYEISSLFRIFGEQNGKKNVFIASTNLNHSDMIPSLLGLTKVPDIVVQTRRESLLGEKGTDELMLRIPPAIPKDKRKEHIINLLDLAAKNAALRNYDGHYREVFDKSVYPDVTSLE